MKNQKRGFTLVEIMIVVMIIGLLAAMALPGFAKARLTTQSNACISNLRQIESAKDQYAMEVGLQAGDAVPLVGVISHLKAMPACPVGGTYALGTVSGSAGAGEFASCGAYHAQNHPATIGNP